MSSSLPDRFVSLATLRKYLEVSDCHLRRQVKSGELQLGVHYLLISSANAKQQSYLWNPVAIQELWSSDPALRVLIP